jgi:hypothetical protein
MRHVSGKRHGQTFHFSTVIFGKKTARLKLISEAIMASLLLASSARAAIWYVDSSVSSSGDGRSWSTAWKNVANITGLSAGDTVYFSGGASGSTRTYSVSSWVPAGGSAGKPITYQIGQDSSHNGTAIFDCSASGRWLGQANNYFALSGDAGDGQRHFQLANCTSIAYWGSIVTGARISYVNCGSTLHDSAFYGYATSFIFDHNYLFGNDMSANYIFTFHGPGDTTGSGWDNVIIGWNEIHVPYGVTVAGTGGNSGVDGLDTHGSGITVVSNLIMGYYGPGGVDHQDGLQFLGDDHRYKVAYNTFVNLANSSMGDDGDFGNNSEIFFYNNLVVQTSAFAADGAHPGTGLWLESEGAGGMWTNVWVVNNTFVNVTMSYMSTQFKGTEFSGCGGLNNLTVNYAAPPGSGWPGSGIVDGGVGVFNAFNQAINQNFSSWFVGYTNDGIPNMQITSAGNSALRNGTNLYGIPALSSYMSFLGVDRNGNPRPTSGPWVLGAYAYSAGSTNPVLSISPATMALGAILQGRTVTNYFTVQNTGGGLLAGTATLSATTNGFRILSGGTYSLGSQQAQTVAITYTPSGPSDSQVVTFTGGGGATAVVSGSLLAAQSGLSFPAYAGYITAPFATNSDGSISQSVETTSVNGGQAVYGFTITNSGNYVVQAMVNAPNQGANSCYVNIDAPSSEPTTAWDIPVTSGYVNQTVSWRGNGSADTNSLSGFDAQYAPKVFTLSQGTHQLIINGREANTQLQSFSIIPMPAAPQNLHVAAIH